MNRSIVIGFLIVVVAAGAAPAGNNPQAKVAVHVVAHGSVSDCAGLPAIADCEDIVTTSADASFDAFPVFFDLVEFTSVGYGLCWPDWASSVVWTQCADEAVGVIAAPGEGVYQSWGECRTQQVLVAGWAWLYADAAGEVTVCNHPETGVIQVLDCAGGTNSPIGIYSSGVAGAEGDDPCSPVAITQTTWGAIKGMFE